MLMMLKKEEEIYALFTRRNFSLIFRLENDPDDTSSTAKHALKWQSNSNNRTHVKRLQNISNTQFKFNIISAHVCFSFANNQR
jgi:hypothetical protein